MPAFPEVVHPCGRCPGAGFAWRVRVQPRTARMRMLHRRHHRPEASRVGLAEIGREGANTVTKAKKTTIIAAIKRTTTPIRDMEAL